jgi:DNA-binding MarR family transcriptional regulator
VPGRFSSDDESELRQAERDVTEALGGLPLDFRSLLAVSNVFRTATAVRNHMERSILAPQELSWSAFVVLFVLRVWGPQESRRLAAEAGITPGTLTGVLNTLERKGMVRRRAHATDGRRVLVTAKATGRRAVDAIMPEFNAHETLVTRDLSEPERDQLSALLRTVLRTVEQIDAAD